MARLTILSFCGFLALQGPVSAQVYNPFVAVDAEAALTEITKARKIFEEGYYEEALDMLDKVRFVSRKVEREHQLLTADILEKKGRFEDAIAILKRLSEDFPRDPQVWSALGAKRFQQTRYAEAAAAYSKVMRYAPEDVVAAYQFYLCELLTKDPENVPMPGMFVEFSDAHPGYYYARAAESFAKGEQDRGMYFVTGATQLFTARDNLVMLRPLFQIGWVHPQEVILYTKGSARPYEK